MNVSLVVSICLRFDVMLLRSIVFSIADVVGCRENIIIEILAAIVAFLLSREANILQLLTGYDGESKIFIDYLIGGSF